jgi:hypothetical protein
MTTRPIHQMTQEPIDPATQEPLDDEERELMDPNNWDWSTTVEGRTIGTPGAVLRVRFTRDEFLDLAKIAREAGVGPVAFIHETMLGVIAAHQRKEEAESQKRPA